MQKKPKKKKRSNTKHPNLNPRLMSRTRQEFHDINEYAFPLDDAAKEWMNQFMGEYLGASLVLDENTKEILPDKNLHQTAKHKKEIYDWNNHRNVDQYGLTKAKVANTNLLQYEKSLGTVEEALASGASVSRMEDVYLDFIEAKQIEAMIKEYQDAMSCFREIFEPLPQEQELPPPLPSVQD